MVVDVGSLDNQLFAREMHFTEKSDVYIYGVFLPQILVATVQLFASWDGLLARRMVKKKMGSFELVVVILEVGKTL